MCEMKKKDSQVVDFDIDGCFVSLLQIRLYIL